MKLLTKFLLALLLLGAPSCQQDEVTIYRFKHVASNVQVDAPKTYEAENKDCPKCGEKEYCNRNTGKCEAVAATSSAVKCESLQGKPVSSGLLVWMDKGGDGPEY